MDGEFDLNREQAPTSSNQVQPPPPWLRWLPVIIVLWAAGFEFRAFLGEGLPISFDAHSHLSRSWMAQRALSAGTIPTWSNDWYGGYRLHEFYSPMYHVLSGALGLLTRDIILSSKILLWVSQVLASLGIYFLIHRTTRNPWLGLFAALFFLRSEELRLIIGVIGNYPTLFIYVLMPVLMGCVVTRSPASRSPEKIFAGHSLLLGAMATGHLTNTLMILPGVLAFEFCWLMQTADSRSKGYRETLGLLASLPAAAAISAFVTLPMWWDVELVSLSLLSEVSSGLHWDARSIWVLLGIEKYSFDFAYMRSPGPVWWGLASAGALASLHPAGPRALPFVAGLIASLATTALLGERAAIGLVFFVVALCAASVEALARLAIAQGLPLARVAVPAAAATLALLLPNQSVLPSDPYSPNDVLSIYTRIPDTPTQSRTFDVTRTGLSMDGIYGQSSFSPYFSGRAIVFGAFPQGAPIATNMTTTLMGEIVHSLWAPEPTLSEAAADLLFLAHVGFLVDRTETENRSQGLLTSDEWPILRRLAPNRAIGQSIEPGLLQLRYASPAIFAPKVRLLPHDYRSNSQAPALLATILKSWLDDPIDLGSDQSLGVIKRTKLRRDGLPLMPLVTRLEIDRETATAAHFYVEHELEPPPPTGTEGRSSFEVLTHRESLAFAQIDARAFQSGFVRLSYSFDPDVEVRLDDRPVPTIADALTGGIVIAFPAGSHTITIRGAQVTARIFLFAGGVLLAALLSARLLTSRR